MRRNRRYTGVKCITYKVNYPPNMADPNEPNLHDILVMYNRGEDITPYIITADKATSSMQQFGNRKWKEDFLSEVYYDSEANKNNISKLQNTLKANAVRTEQKVEQQQEKDKKDNV